MPLQDILIKICLAVLVGGIIGAEREYRSKSAGLRTLILICVGAAIFTMISMLVGEKNSPDRIASNIVTGIGFVGAGVIFKTDNQLNGITTAATIWITASLGMAIGAGHYWIAGVGCTITIIVLLALKIVGVWIDKKNLIRDYKIVCNYETGAITRFDVLFKDCNLEAHNKKRAKIGNLLTGYWIVQGSKKNHRDFVEAIINDRTVVEFEY